MVVRVKGPPAVPGETEPAMLAVSSQVDSLPVLVPPICQPVDRHWVGTPPVLTMLAEIVAVTVAPGATVIGNEPSDEPFRVTVIPPGTDARAPVAPRNMPVEPTTTPIQAIDDRHFDRRCPRVWCPT